MRTEPPRPGVRPRDQERQARGLARLAYMGVQTGHTETRIFETLRPPKRPHPGNIKQFPNRNYRPAPYTITPHLDLYHNDE